MKLGRSEKCHYGSGLKYKKCCKTKSAKTEKPFEITLSTLINAIKSGLENLDKLKGSKQKIRVKNTLPRSDEQRYLLKQNVHP